MIQAFRTAGMKVLWINWGLDNFDLLMIPPAFLSGFSPNDIDSTSFGSDMGIIAGGIEVGPKLMCGAWNV